MTRSALHLLRLATLLGVVVAVTAGAEEARVPVSEVTLDNGMRLLLVERDEAATVAAGWVAHVGSANETYGSTGIAHLFEHMMFKGTTTIGTRDIEAERKIMAELDLVRAEMEAEYETLREAKRRGEIEGSVYDPELQTPRLAELRDRLTQLQARQAELIVKEEFDTVYTREGASGINAGTTNDLTLYFSTVPANKLELWFWMESERLLRPVFREFYSERDVVREERRMRVESDPTAKFEEQFDAMFWASTPYAHPVVGWATDVESISREQADRFFATYYAPNNLTAALVGSFDREQALALAERYFGRIPRGETPPPPLVTEPTEQLAPRRMVAEADTNPSVQLRWHGVPFVHRDAAVLDVVTDLLSGRTGRLYRALVEEKGLAAGEPYAYQQALRLAGMVEVGAEVADGSSHAEVERALLAEVERLKREPVGERELEKVKNQGLADSYRRLQSNFGLMLQLLFYDALGDWRFLNEAYERTLAVTPEDIRRAANEYFTSEGLNALWFERKPGTAPEDPELAALPGPAREYAQRMLAQIATIDDPQRLRIGLEQLRAQAAEAPPEFQRALEYVAAKIEERIAGLAAGAGEEE